VPLAASLRARARHFAFRHVGGSALVLLYHRVTHRERDPQLLTVTPEHFDAQMAVLAERHHVVPLSELVEGIRGGRVPDRAIAITFDDGYADNLLDAAPILARHAVPATFYVSSGFVEEGRPFWCDEVERLVLAPGTLPRSGRLSAGDVALSFDLGGFSHYTAEQARLDAPWTVLDPATNPRQALYAELCAFVRPLPVAQQTELLARLREAAGVADASPAADRPLSPEEVVALDSIEGLRIGGHTRSHVLLSGQPVAEQRGEIEADRGALDRICGRPIESFSYPFGGLGDYSAETVAILRAAGYTHACANHVGVVKPWTDPFRIPRNIVRDWDAPTFLARIEGRFDEPR